jgi:hypothetical protein
MSPTLPNHNNLIDNTNESINRMIKVIGYTDVVAWER